MGIGIPTNSITFLSELVKEIDDINSIIAPLKEKRDKARANAEAKERKRLESLTSAQVDAEAKIQALAAAKKLIAEARAEAKIEADAKVEAKERAAAIIAAEKLVKETK